MTEMMELAAGAVLDAELAECPFKDESEGPAEADPENIGDDDDDGVQEQQANNGGVLGTNLTEASAGKAGTVGGPFPPPTQQAMPARDTARNFGGKAWVPESDLLNGDAYPYTVAAHHVIPGNASLAPSSLFPYMTQGETIQTESGKSWTIKHHIGYNVNGCHNGVWLPGNYAIRKYAPPSKRRKVERLNTSPLGGPKGGANWSGLEEVHSDWQLHYVAAACKVTRAQFHDTHEAYSNNVKDLLNKIEAKVLAHQENCEDCAGKLGQEVPPPYVIKARLYAISAALRERVVGMPAAWKLPWFTSDRWSGTGASRKRQRVESKDLFSPEFDRAYDAAKEVS